MIKKCKFALHPKKSIILTKTATSVTELPIMETFYTVQGEGFYSGRAAFFIRIAGCDVGCVDGMLEGCVDGTFEGCDEGCDDGWPEG